MYKKFLTIFIFVFLIVLIPKLSFASSISLRSSSKTIEPGKSFNILIYVNSPTLQSFTAQANISFPSDLVSVESFSYANSWMPIVQPGYDVIDNNGKLIKTAGYPNGFTGEKLLGTLVLKSKKAGVVNISTNKDSYLLDMDSNDTLTNYGSVSITSNLPVVTVAPPVKENIKKVEPLPKETKIEKPIVEVIEIEAPKENLYNKKILNNLFLFFNGALIVNEFFNILF